MKSTCYSVTLPPEQCKHFQRGSSKGAIKATFVHYTSFCDVELQACSGHRGKGEQMIHVTGIIVQKNHIDQRAQISFRFPGNLILIPKATDTHLIMGQ